MAIPDFQTLMLPLLRHLADEKEHQIGEIADALSDEFDLTQEERRELLPSGVMTIMRNRVGWAKGYLKQAGLLEYPKRGYSRITERGLQLLDKNPQRIDSKFLEQYPEFQEFRSRKRRRPDTSGGDGPHEGETPEEALERAYQELRTELEAELLESVKKSSPAFFERLVVELLVKMGYGGTLKDAGQAVGQTGDGGIDGIIKEDRLGLDAVYVQAKRWEAVVGRPEIQKFAGALQGFRARKGVFITTSSFSKEAVDYVKMIESRIVLIDGAMLGSLMIDHDVGVSTVGAFPVKRIDTDYFSED